MLRHTLLSIFILAFALSLDASAVTITTPPQPLSILQGDTAVFLVQATGTGPLTYQWKKNGSDIPGSTNQALVLHSTVAGDAGTYSVTVSDAGPSTVTSGGAVLSFRTPVTGDMDLSFPGGAAMNGIVAAVAVQSDGRVVIGGNFTTIHHAPRVGIARLEADGSLDYSFGSGLAGVGGSVSGMALQGDGKIVIVGSFATVNGVPRAGIARLNSDGSLDTTFCDGLAGANNAVYAVALMGDGKIIVGGAFTSFNGTARGYIARLHSDGSLDTTFGDGLAGANNNVHAVAVQSDGKVVIGGLFIRVNGTVRARIARLNSDGTLDTTFAIGLAGPNNIVSALAVQSDGKLVIGGYFSKVNGTDQIRIARLNGDGTLDTGFGNGLAGASDALSSIVVLEDGKVLIAGAFGMIHGTGRGGIARLNSDGTLDTGFGNGLAGADGGVAAMALRSDGKVVIGGYFSRVNGTEQRRISRLNSDGTLDPIISYPQAGTEGSITAIAVQSDGKVLIGGLFGTINGIGRRCIARLNSDGTVDAGFGNGLSGAADTVYSIAVQSDGKIYICGAFYSVNGTARALIARLNSDGALDTTFGDGLGANATISSMAVQGDGKVVIGGFFSDVYGQARGGIARINSDGRWIDFGFSGGLSGTNGFVTSVALQSDGKVLIAGGFTTVNGTARGRIARLHSDGTLDTTFADGLAGANNTISTMSLQSNGKMVITGSFTTVNGTARGGIARLNNDGTLDTTFGNGLAGADNTVSAVAMQSDGKMIIGGNFSLFNGTARVRIARLNGDCTLDSSFGMLLSGANGAVSAVSVQSDAKEIIVGAFTS
ncbi:MAG: immunoglobulin domain-containing protein, partial [Prosthecobacter sp.]